MKEPRGRRASDRRDLLAGMAHELRTPLNLVIGFSDSLAQTPDCPPEQVAEYATAIHGAGQQLLALVNIWLDVARIEQGVLDLQNDTIDLAALLDVSAQGALARVTHGGARLEMAEMPSRLRLRGDEKRLRQMLSQLIGHALTFTQAGGCVTVRTIIDPAGDLALIVHDIGLSQGLGLYLSQSLAEAHGGRFILDGTASGTTVTITLPAARLIRPSPTELLQDLS
jgi:signal transduction histidine kinase